MPIYFNPFVVGSIVCINDFLYNILNIFTLNSREKSNILNLMHACFVSVFVGYEIIYGINSADHKVYYDITIGHFLYDLINQEDINIFVAHHVISIYALVYFRISLDFANQARAIYFYSEVGNLAIYSTHLLKSCSKYKMIVVSAADLIKVYVIELCWYAYFRVFMLVDILSKTKVNGCVLDILGFILLIATTIWSIKLLRIIIHDVSDIFVKYICNKISLM